MIEGQRLLSFPPVAGIGCYNHWIPAFAGRLRGSSAACSRPACLLQAGAALPRLESPASMQACPYNDGEGWSQVFARHSKGAVRMTTNLFRPPSSFRRRPESRKAVRGVNGWPGLPDGTFGCRARVLAFPLCGNGLSKPLDSSFRWNDAEADRRRPATL